MATERNVVDFKIHNLTEEQFQELKAQGKIDPNAVYCTPDESLKKNQITNCITEIPQDIKLELADGVLTLKAGSKVYVPNGSGVFDEYIISGDIVVGTGGNNGSYLLFYRTDKMAYANINVSSCTSGTTVPTTGNYMFYNTNDNTVRHVNNGVASGVQWSLPLAKITVASGAISIDQVFNGFGYMGSTLFALPGVKGLIPNGRNEDGALKNIEFATNSVDAKTVSSRYANLGLYLGSIGNVLLAPSELMIYDEKDNTYKNGSFIVSRMFVGDIKVKGGKIVSLEPRTTLHAVDYSLLKTKQDTDSSVNHNNITNCITKIPQDIKLELANGELTLKAGSKVYMPDGGNVYNEFIAQKDYTYTAPTSAGPGQQMLFWAPKTGGLIASVIEKTVSGSRDSLSGTTYHTWWNIIDNIINRYGGDATKPVHQLTFPLCLYTFADGVITSIDQVFNGFGYMGSTLFALPGVKGLIPNGRNEDGALKNIEFKSTKVSTTTATGVGTKTLTMTAGGVVDRSGGFRYDPEHNYNYNYDSKTMQCNCGTFVFSSDFRITSLEPKTTFQAVDYNDTAFIAHQAMPSDRYVSLTLPASGETITAPADGYIYINKTSGAAGQGVVLGNGVYEKHMIAYASDEKCRVLYPVNKGVVVAVNYTLSGITNAFRFIYANGTK